MRIPLISLAFLLLLNTCQGPVLSDGIIYPEDCLVHNGGAVIDITRPPYNADNTGKEDVTEILIQAVDDVLGADRDLMKRTLEILQGDPSDVVRADERSFEKRQAMARANPEAVIGFERTAGIFPYVNPPSRIIYFPDGIYLVSNTITYRLADHVNRAGRELNRMLHFQGQSEAGSIIRLADKAPGFGEGKRKPVISFTRGNHSNVSMQNSFENLSIEIGKGNPGAVGLEFFSNNTGAVRHVSVRSLDPEHRARAGVAIYVYNSSCALLQHINVDGCDYGIEIREHRLYTAMEHIHLKNQRKAGFLLSEHNVAVRGLVSHNSVPAVSVEGSQATLSLIDSRFTGGAENIPAISMEGGFLLARNIKVEDYASSLTIGGETIIAEKGIREYVSHACPKLHPEQTQATLDLPIKDSPEIPWEQDPERWVSVNQFGAVADGLADDTEAIQKAMLSGAAVVYFKPGTYLIDSSIIIPAHVNRVNFMYCDLVAGGRLQLSENTGTFKVVGDSDSPLIIEDLFAFERYFGKHYLVDHASRRTLILSDLHTQVGAQYINSVSGGKVFIENVCATDQFPPYKNCFSFRGQQVWARQLNPERSNPEVLNEGGYLWVLGFKSEKSGTAFLTIDGGKTEILGGIFNISRAADSHPMVVTRDAKVSVFASTTDHRVRPATWNLRPFIEDIRKEKSGTLIWNQFPRREKHLIVIPLYTNVMDED